MSDATAFLDGFVPPREQSRALVPVGRPPFEAVPEGIADKICNLVAKGKSLRKIAEQKGMPHYSTIRRWLTDDKAFRHAYAIAKGVLADDALAEVLEIADGAEKDTLAVSEFKVNTRFRMIAKLAPYKYGDAPQIEAPDPTPRNGDDAKVINEEPIKAEDDPLFSSFEAWRRGEGVVR
jgi:hypothetical protein